MRGLIIGAMVVITIMTACSSPEEPTALPPQQPNTELDQIIEQSPIPPRWYDFAQVTRGGRLYAEHCAMCHGRQGEGAADWRRRGPDGKSSPPPLNGTGHAWHHPLALLYRVIMNGSPGGQGNMPAWKDKLSREESVSIIAWFQSQWPDKIYGAWYARDQQARAKASGQ